MGEAAVIELCRCPALARLTHLDLGNSAVTDAVARALAECPYLDGIELLACPGGEDQPPSSPGVEERLRERFGNRVVLDPAIHWGGPVRHAYRYRVLTGRRR